MKPPRKRNNKKARPTDNKQAVRINPDGFDFAGLADSVDELVYTGLRLSLFIKEQGMLLDDR